MKSCPTCNRTFEDTFTFCLIDGAILSAPFDPAESRHRPAPPGGPPVTQFLSPPTLRAETPPGPQSTLHVAAPPASLFHQATRPREIATQAAEPSILLRLSFVLRGLLAVAFGIFAIWAQSFQGLGHPFVVYAFIVGLVGIICGIKTFLDFRNGWLLVLEGVLNLTAAVALFMIYQHTVYSLLIAPGGIIIGAVFQIGAAVQLRRKIKGVWPLALSGATSLVFGFALLIVLIFAIASWVQ